MGQFSTRDFVGTRTRFQRLSDSKLFHGWIQSLNVSSMVIRTSTDCLLKKSDRFIFHVASSHANARFIADFNAVDGLELVRTSTIQLENLNTANMIDVPEANFSFKLMSQLEYQPPTEEARHMVDGWVVQVKGISGVTDNAFISDVSESGAGVLGPVAYQRGERIRVHFDAGEKSLDLEAEVRYSVRSKIAPDMFKTGLQFSEFGRLEGAVWRNLLRAA